MWLYFVAAEILLVDGRMFRFYFTLALLPQSKNTKAAECLFLFVEGGEGLDRIGWEEKKTSL